MTARSGDQTAASRPVISAVLPVYGVQQYLAECLDSVLAHPGADLEVIAVDDASPDGCGEILDARAALDPRLKVIHLERNGGPGNARNTGLDVAIGDYLWFIDSDDIVTPGAVAAIIERLGAELPDVLLIDYEYLYPGGRTAPSFGNALLRGAPDGPCTLAEQPQLIGLTMVSWSRVISRQFLVELGVRFLPGIHEDVPVSCATLLAADRIAVLARVCYRYRFARPGSFMVATSSGNMAIFGAYRQVFDFLSKREAAGAQAPVGLRTALFERAIWHYSTVLQTGGLGVGPAGRSGLVPRRERRRFFARMHEDFGRYAPPGYRYPPGARGAKFRLIGRDAYVTYELLEPLNRARVTLRRLTSRQQAPSNTLLGRGEGGGEPVEGDGLAAQGAGAEDDGEHDLQLVQDLVQGHPGAGTFGSVLIIVQNAWARTARVTWRCQPVNERPSKWSRPRPCLSSR